jgi:hypothetical protein
MYLRQHSQFLFTLFRQFHQDAPAVSVIRDPPEQPELGHAVNQLHRGVMPNQQKFRQFADREGSYAGEPFDGEKRLMLLRREPGVTSSRFAERQKFSKLKAKLRQSFVVDQMSVAAGLSFGLDSRLARRLRFRSKHPLPANEEKNSYTIGGRARLISAFLDGRPT